MDIPQSEQLENTNLLIKLREGDESAFIKIYNQYRSKVYTYSYQLSKSTVTAEETVQEVFIKIWHKREQLNTELSFSAYIKKITLNHVLNHLKKVARERALQEQVFNNIETSSNKTEDRILEKELRKIYEEAIERLPQQKKLIYQMSRKDELSHDEIARQLNISKNTVKNHMVEATRSIREYVSKNGSVICFIIASANYFHSN
ncbi:RNA polymerase sigma factor [Pedobacter cryoconitis]|uniref:RNA polymerase sigma-70 factor (ECF subfamily) n=1 Tax=Pedobacter cryoconitis TaxID=188932 RepID=A0A7X0J564_9SPHI|nr:RNA polymerase sigma-70 factor [Pedobacter cryoconitis]MBB6501336.1 RNA polymerase sigma-70 factor (ECF subfamily) [Pedobacter cryoconitis]